MEQFKQKSSTYLTNKMNPFFITFKQNLSKTQVSNQVSHYEFYFFTHSFIKENEKT